MPTLDVLTLARQPAPLPTPEEMIDAVYVAPDGWAVFYGVPWETYEALLDVIGDGLPRVTYDDGAMDLELPGDLNELLNGIAADFARKYMEAFAIDFVGYGSITLRRPAARNGGLEPDSSFYIQNYAAVAGRRIDLSIHPPRPT